MQKNNQTLLKNSEIQITTPNNTIISKNCNTQGKQQLKFKITRA